MEEIQFFRVSGKTDIEKLPCHHVNGQSIIYWDDIEQAFPGVSHVKNDDVPIKLLSDSTGNM